MTLWIDAQLPPAIAAWIVPTFGIEARAVRELGLRYAKDPPIFQAARAAKAVVMDQGRRFRRVTPARLGPPPQVLWVTCGNTSNASLREMLARSLPVAFELLERGESLVEISSDTAGGRPFVAG